MLIIRLREEAVIGMNGHIYPLFLGTKLGLFLGLEKENKGVCYFNWNGEGGLKINER